MATETLPRNLEADNSEALINAQLQRTRSQVKGVEIGSRVLKLVVGVLAFFLLATLLDHWVVGEGLPIWARVILWLTLIAGILWYFVRSLLPLVIYRVNPLYAARTIEETKPSLKNSLINYLTLRPEQDRLPTVIYDAIAKQAARGVKDASVDHAVDHAPLIRWGYLLLGLTFCFALYFVLSPKNPFRTVARVVVPWADLTAPSRVQIVEVTPGSAQLYRGKTVKVSARIEGLDEEETATLHYTTADGQQREQPIKLKLDDLRNYTTTLPVPTEKQPGVVAPPRELAGLQQDFEYYITAGDARTKTFKVQVAPAPYIGVERIEYKYPAYTKKPPETRQGEVNIEALEGTTVTVHGTANQPLKKAWIELRDHAGKPAKFPDMKITDQMTVGSWTLGWKDPNSRDVPDFASYALRFRNQQGDDNPEPIAYPVKVVRDESPTIDILAPSSAEITVPWDQPITFEVRAQDPDFGLIEVQLNGMRGEKNVFKQNIASYAAANAHQGILQLKHTKSPKDLGLQVGDIIEYHMTATDNKVPNPNIVLTAPRTLRVIEAQKNRKPDNDPLAKKDQQQRNQGDPQDNNGQRDPNQAPQQNNQQQQNDPANPMGNQGQPNPDQPNNGQGDAQQANDPNMRNQDQNNQAQNPNDPRQPPQNGNNAAQNKPNQEQNPNDKPQNPDNKKQQQNGGDAGKNGAQQNKPSQGNKGNQPDPQDQKNQPQNGNQGNDQQPNNNQNSQPSDQNGKPEQNGNQQSGKPDPNQQANGQSQPKDNKLKSDGSQDADAFERAFDHLKDKDFKKPEQKQNDQVAQNQPPNSGDKNNPENKQQAGKPEQGNSEAGNQKEPSPQNAGKEPSKDQPENPRGNKPENGKQEPGKPEQGKPHNDKQDGNQPGEASASNDPTQQNNANNKPNNNGKSGSAKNDAGMEPSSNEAKQQADNKNAGQQEPNGANKPDSKQGDQSPNGAGQKPDPMSPQQQQPGAGDKSGDHQAGKTGAGEKPEAGAKADQGNKPEQNGNKPGDMNPDGNRQGNEKKEAGANAKPSNSQENKPGNATAPENKQSPKNDQNQSGGGNPNGSPEAQDKGKPNENPSNSNTNKNDDQNKEQSPSNKGNDSASQGEEGGDKNGGGKQGGGQQENKQGRGASGSNTPDEKGANASKEEGDGETGSEAGKNNNQQSNDKTGKSGNEAGNGSEKKQGDGKQPGGDPGKNAAEGKNEAAGKQPGKPEGEPGGQGNSQASSPKPGNSKDGPAGNMPGNGGGGQPSSEIPPAYNGPDPAAPEDPINDAYTKKATDLVLEQMKNQLRTGNVDPELRKKLGGWSDQQMQDFVNRWEANKRAAEQPGPASNAALNKFRNLGLRPEQSSNAGDSTADDSQRGNRVNRRSAPPSEYRDIYRAFQKGASGG